MYTLYVLSFAIPICLQVAILILVLKHKVQHRFRWFLVYVSFALFQEIARLIASSNNKAYYVVYWFTAALEVFFIFMAIRESFLNVFWAFTRLRWFRRLFWICISLAILYSVAKAVFQPPSDERSITVLILHAEQTFEYLVCATGLFYFAATKWFHIKEHQWEYKVVLGFFLIAAISNLGFVIRSIFGTRFAKFVDWLPALAYIIGVFVWLLNFSQTEPKQPKPTIDLTPEHIMAEIKSYQEFIRNARTFWRRKSK
jgi:hypothetical protein